MKELTCPYCEGVVIDDEGRYEIEGKVYCCQECAEEDGYIICADCGKPMEFGEGRYTSGVMVCAVCQRVRESHRASVKRTDILRA